MPTNQRTQRFTPIIWPLLAFLISACAAGWTFKKLKSKTVSLKPSRQAASNAESQPSRAQPRGFSSDEEMISAIMSAAVQDEPLLRAHQLHETLGRSNSAELPVLFDKAVELRNTDRRQSLLHALLERWITVDRDAAAKAVHPYQDRFRSAARIDWGGLDAIVSRLWAGLAPEETLAEAMTSPETRWARDLASIALSSLANGEEQRKLETLSMFPDGNLRRDLCEITIKALAEKDYAAAESHLGLLTDPRMRVRVQAEILGVLAKRDPSAALAQLGEMSPRLPAGVDGLRIINEVLSVTSKKDPQGSLAAIDQLPSNFRTQAIGSVLTGWAGENPLEALKWSAVHGVDPNEAKKFVHFSDIGMSWQTLMTVAFDRDREKTLEWIRTQPASSGRDSMLTNGFWGATLEQKIPIYNEITPAGQVGAVGDLLRSSFSIGIADNFSKVESWVRDLPPGDARCAAIQALAGYQAGRTANYPLKDIIDAWSPGPERDAALGGIASSVANREPLRGVEYARQVSDPGARELAFEKIVQAWLQQDKSAARAWIAGAPELSAGQKRVLLRQADEQ